MPNPEDAADGFNAYIVSPDDLDNDDDEAISPSQSDCKAGPKLVTLKSERP